MRGPCTLTATEACAQRSPAGHINGCVWWAK